MCIRDSLYREHLIRKSWVYSERPVLINNWEGTYFDFDEKKIFDIAKEASKHGIETVSYTHLMRTKP